MTVGKAYLLTPTWNICAYGWNRVNPKVSVIIPTKNRATYVSSAIRSVLCQTFRDFEVIVIDAASTDNTKEVISNFSDKRVRLFFEKKDRGVSASRNLGIVLSKGEFIAFLDDDDQWTQRKLEKQLELIRSRPNVGVVFSGGYWILEDGKLLGIYLPSVRGNIFPKILETNFVGNCSGVLVRRECLDKNGRFDESLRAGEDWDMWIRLAKHYEFDYVNEPLLLYRIHERRITTKPYVKLQAAKLMFNKFFPDLYLSPNRAKTLGYWYYELGRLYCECGDMRKGREEFMKALRMNPACGHCYLRLYASYFGTRIYNASRVVVKSALPVSLISQFI
jgi:glycosyltransferase involved in cell wall biosynthesis